MTNIFTLENFDNFSEKINLDELYEKKRQQDLSRLELFKKILNRIHARIKTTAKLTANDTYCWFLVPEIIIGVPKYDQAACIAYLMNALEENQFRVKYFHPNTLFICWNHWIPSYVRNEIKKNTGIIIDELGNKIEEKQEDDENSKEIKSMQQINNSKKYTPIKSYKPSGKFVYSEDLLNRIENKLN